MKIYYNKHLLLLIRIFIGLVFLYSGIQKIADASGFANAIENYRLFPLFTINLLAITIPWLELITGLFLIFGIYIKESTTIINSLLIFFIIFIITALIRKLNIECGCFGTLDNQKVGIQKIIENLILLLLGYFLFRTEKYQKFTIFCNKWK